MKYCGGQLHAETVSERLNNYLRPYTRVILKKERNP